MRVLTLLNQKGGVGKSSCSHHLSGALALMGRRVLLVDNDPQSSLSQGFFGPVAALSIDPSQTVAALYRGDRPFPEQVIRPTGFAGIDILPGSVAATDFNVPRPFEADDDAQHCLRSFLAEAAGSYDVALIDCPPNLHLCSWAALVASDHIVVPMQPEDYGAQGIGAVSESIERVQAGPNPSLDLLGYLLTRVGKKAVHQLYENRLRSLYGEDVFAARVPDAVAYVEAIAARKPIGFYRPKGAPAQAIRDLAAELLSRVESRSGAATAMGVA